MFRSSNKSEKEDEKVVGVYSQSDFLPLTVFAVKDFRIFEDNQNLQSEIMASFNHQSHSTKRWFIWLFSIWVGVIGVLLLIFVNLRLSNHI